MFFHSLKAELVRGRKFETAYDLRGALNRHINQLYNYEMIDSGIGYSTKAQFECPYDS